MKRSELQMVFAVNVAKLILYIKEQGYACTFGEAYRPPEMCAIYAKDGRGIKNSLHAIRLAVDLNLFMGGVYMSNTEAYRFAGEYWESLDPLNKWGGRFNDGNHFETREG